MRYLWQGKARQSFPRHASADIKSPGQPLLINSPGQVGPGFPQTTEGRPKRRPFCFCAGVLRSWLSGDMAGQGRPTPHPFFPFPLTRFSEIAVTNTRAQEGDANARGQQAGPQPQPAQPHQVAPRQQAVPAPHCCRRHRPPPFFPPVLLRTRRKSLRLPAPSTRRPGSPGCQPVPV